MRREIIKLGEHPVRVGNVTIYRNKYVTWHPLKVKVKSEKLRVSAIEAPSAPPPNKTAVPSHNNIEGR